MAPPGPFLLGCLFFACVTTKEQREDPQLFHSLFKKGRGTTVQLWADTHFCAIPPPPFLQLPRFSHFIRLAAFRSLGPGRP